MKLKNVLMISFLAIAGIFGASSAIVNNEVKETPVVEKAEAADISSVGLHYTPDGSNWYDVLQSSKSGTTYYYDAINFAANSKVAVFINWSDGGVSWCNNKYAESTSSSNWKPGPSSSLNGDAYLSGTAGYYKITLLNPQGNGWVNVIFEKVNVYTVSSSVSPSGYGSVTPASISNVISGTSYTVSSNKVTVGSTTITATAASQTAQYTYTFTGWTKGGSAAPASGTITADTTFVANFSRSTRSYTVSFNMKGHGSAPSSQTKDYGAKVDEPSDPSVTGYIFGGWYKETGCTNAWNFTTDTVTGTTVLYAKWTAKTTTITLDNQGATTPGQSSVTGTYGSGMPSIAANLPEKDGAYSFQGYYDAKNGGGTKYYNADGTSARTWNKDVDTSILYAFWRRAIGFYVIDCTGGTDADMSTAIYQDETPVAGNSESWTEISLTGNHTYRIIYYDPSTDTKTDQNHSFDGHYSNIGITAKAKDTFDVTVTGTYKVFYTTDFPWKLYINKDFNITCYAVVGGNTTQAGVITCNSDVALSNALGNVYAGYEIEGYYSDEGCTTPITVDSYYPSLNTSIYAKCSRKPTIANNKVRVWIGYDGDNPFYRDGGEIKLWIHSTSGGGSELVYSERDGTYNNTQESYRRYDYFDVDLSCYTNSWYLTVQRFINGSWNAATTALQLSSSNVGKVYYVGGEWASGATSGIYPGSIESCDALLAVWAMDGLHTCSSSVYNGYGAFDNYNETFVKNGNEWRVVGSLSDYTVLDFNDGDTSYSHDPTKVTNAYAKYQWLYYQSHGGVKPGPALGNFSFLMNGESGDNATTIIIIIAASVSLLSITALSILLVKKRKRVDN